MPTRHIQWLYEELPRLVAAGVVPPDVAQRLRTHYGAVELAPESRTRQRVLLAVFGVFGAALVASGILLLLAHNWDQMSRPMRVGLAFAPLITGQTLAVFALLRHRTSAVWCESTAIFVALSAGGCIALVGQIYHLPGDTRAFLAAWALLSLPLVYTHRATLAAVLYMGLSLGWLGESWRNEESAPLFWIFAAALVPFLAGAIRRDRRGLQTQLLAWTFCPWIGAASLMITRSDIPWMTQTHIALMLTAMLLGGIALGATPVSYPLRLLGFVGISIELLIFTFDDSFPRRFDSASSSDLPTWLLIHHYVVLLVTAGIAGLLALRVLPRRPWVALWAATPLLIFVTNFAANLKVDAVAMAWVINVWVFILGLEAVLRGSRRSVRSALIGGVTLLALLGLVRFFDSNLSFVLRGVLFVLIGIAFIAGNVYLLRRTRHDGEKTP